ncbi:MULTISPECIES: hypothetical protein [Stenotrophomonas]|jgi:hypothetical protein|uniref:Uncharacterized protein n=1 Tax=Stenotrophomonas maltophilia TaxID=40324 RepID=A0AAI9FV23_STEMA|nr:MULTISPECIES: hypothetical protein [Stenotrophomonas]EKT4439484.1 hypothetical protein [Stenotrophomonas maltophilia]MBB1135752.1 hypothetical protein [Stenotrophomonas sp. I18B00994]MBH1561255.1 hypothetical protein [Stenotrophomonas maltophilia]HDS1140525.1 hypothetical protein [Stenotrophomonas maltophilia]HEL3835354.1 hypothetical protein [Stenotrophomonas maltophilia]
MKSKTKPKDAIGYPMFYETKKVVQLLDKRAEAAEKSRAQTIREFVWDFIESPNFSRVHFANLGCECQRPKPTNPKHLDPGRRSGIGFIPDAQPIVKRVNALAAAYGVSTTDLVRYILRKNVM